MVARRQDAGNSTPRRPPATTPEARDNQMINLAYKLAEQQMLDGTAPAMLTAHFLKLGAANAKLAEEKIRNENLLLQAKVNQIDSSGRTEELYTNAINAMRGYQGLEPLDE